jgi:Flp pilus assembly protein TadD
MAAISRAGIRNPRILLVSSVQECRMSFRLLVVAACLVCAVGCRSRAPRNDGPKLMWQAAPRAAAPTAPTVLTASDGTGLILRELRARVVIEAALAFTELELSLQNPEPRQLEGRLSLRLPPGASIARLALQVGERLQEGELVAQPQAIEAYEQALHGRRDPLLLEPEGGDQYQMRIFPIEAHQTRRVIVAYSELLLGARGYRLPLRGLPRIGRLHVELDTHDDTPAHHVLERKDSQPDADVTFALSAPQLALESDGLVLVPLTTSAAATPDPASLSRLTLLLDTSASGAGELEQRLERVRLLLEALTRRRGSAFPVQIVAFDQELFALPELSSDSFGAEQAAALRERGALGATDLGAALTGLAALPKLGDRLLLYSDGLVTAGDAAATALSARLAALKQRGVRRLDVITPSSRFDGRLLGALARGVLPEAGVVVAEDEPTTIAQRLSQRVQQRLSPSVHGAAWTYPTELRGLEADRSYPLFAKLSGSRPDWLEVAGRRWPLRKASSAGAALLRRAWAQAQVAYLEHKAVGLLGDEAERVRQRVLDLSLHQRVPSAHTAWVVLESDDDYARHHIERRSARVLGVKRGALAQVNGGGPLDDWLLEEPWLRPPRAKAEKPQGTAPDDVAVEARGLRQGDTSPAELAVHRIGLPSAGVGLSSGASGPANSGRLDGFGFGALAMARHGGGGGFDFGLRARPRERPASATDARVRLVELSVEGALSRELMRQKMQGILNKMRSCYGPELRLRPHLRGVVKLGLLIGDYPLAGGGVGVITSTLGSTKVEACVVQALRDGGWYPDIEDGHRAHVEVSFGFGNTAREEREANARERARRVAERRQRELHYQQRPQPSPSDALDGPLLSVSEALDRGASDEALDRAWKALRAAPQDMLAVLALARAASAHGDTSLAARAYGALIDLYPARAELRRAAGQGLESLGTSALALAIDSYRKAVALRPDHPSGVRMLAMALWRAGQREAAHVELSSGGRWWRLDRFPGIRELVWSELDRTRDDSGPLLRACLYWENDATDVDLHLYDGKHRYASGSMFENPGPRANADVERGFGPECISASGDDIAFPYLLQVQYASRGAMGHALGAVHILRVDASGAASFEMRPFVLMKEGAYADLGELRER